MPILTPGSDSRRQSGFSLFELMVVLILIALSVGIVMPSFSRGLKGLELETAGRDFITRMKQARSQAISRQQVFRMILIQDKENPDFYLLANEYEQEINRFSLPEDVSIVFEEEVPDVEQLLVRINFYPNGRSSGGFFFLKNENREIGIWVDPITGFARVMRTEAAEN